MNVSFSFSTVHFNSRQPVTYNILFNPGSNSSIVHHAGKDLRRIVTGLEPFTTYSIRVQACQIGKCLFIWKYHKVKKFEANFCDFILWNYIYSYLILLTLNVVKIDLFSVATRMVMLSSYMHLMSNILMCVLRWERWGALCCSLWSLFSRPAVDPALAEVFHLKPCSTCDHTDLWYAT